MPTIKEGQKAGDASGSAEILQLQDELARLEKKYQKLAMEKNFLERAMGDLNFHNNAHDGVVYTDAKGNITYANPYFFNMMGIENHDEIMDKPFPEYMWKSPKEADRLLQDISKDGFVREREMALFNQEGQAVFAMCSGVASRDGDGTLLGTEIMFCNITSKRTFQAELMEQHALLDAILQSTPDPVLVLAADLKPTRSNLAAEKLFEIEPKDEPFGSQELLAKVTVPEEVISNFRSKLSGSEAFELEVEIKGQIFEVHAAPLKSAQKGWVLVLHNVTVRKRTQDMLEHHAFHDPLTQLPNRAYFSDYLQRAQLRASTEPSYHYAVLFIDLDNLKRMNDTFGHHTGDQLLIEFAQRLDASIRPDDLVSRIGGDEFAVLVDGVHDESAALQVAARIQHALLEPYQFPDQQELRATASIGVAMSSSISGDVESLLSKADEAMYQVKKRGGDSYEIFNEKTLHASKQS